MVASLTPADLLAAARAALGARDAAAALALLPPLAAAILEADALLEAAALLEADALLEAAALLEADAHPEPRGLALLETRALLEQLAADTLDPALLEALPALDLRLDATDLAFQVPPAAPGLAALLADTPLPPDRWWTRPFGPLAAARDAALRAALAPAGARAVPERPPGERPPGPGPERLPDAASPPPGRAASGPRRLAAEGLGPHPAAAAARGAAPLLLWAPDTDQAHVARLEAWRFLHPVNPCDPRLGPDAARALRAAWWVAGALTPAGHAPSPPATHHFALAALTGDAVIDGPSLGLPAVLALLSAWGGGQVASDLAATGEIQLDAAGQPRLLPVAGVAAKAAAWLAAGGRRLAVHPANLAAVPSGLEAVRVDPPNGRGLRRLLAAAGLDPAAIETAAGGLSQAEHEAAIEGLCARIRTQAVDDPSQPERAGHSPYQRAADRLRHHLDHLGDALPPEPRARATAEAIVAYGLAGDREGAAAMIQRLEALRQDPAALPPAAQVELHIARVSHLIHGLACEPPAARPDLEACLSAEGAALQTALAGAPAWSLEAIAGRAHSSLGRIALHRGAPFEALPHLADARDAFSHPRQRHERGRCRIYLAMAQRAAGLLDDAYDQLAEARTDLDAYTLPYSAPYHAECLLYWRYEVGRLALARGRPAQALAPLRRAEESARWRGYWPLAGVLRSLTLAGDPGALDRLAALTPPPGQGRLHAALLAEARGGQAPDTTIF